MAKIIRLQHAAVTVPVDRLAEARTFYTDILGLREVPRPPELQDRPGIWYSFGSTELHIQARDGVAQETGDRHPALIVDDIEAWRARFAEYGVEVIDQPTIYNRRRFNVRDPFGNLLELTTEGDALL
ncbi:MAG TPA: VOC family protein [Rhodanobacteraceae bacterium]|nr:VOC family protein [Rhodanobacteraceae bacterium]